jgi:hypothetical protein
MKAEVRTINGKLVMQIDPETPFEFAQSQEWLRSNMRIIKGEKPFLDVMSFDLKLMEGTK